MAADSFSRLPKMDVAQRFLMSEFVFSILSLMWTPFNYDLPILVVPYGFGVVVVLFAFVKRLGGFNRV